MDWEFYWQFFFDHNTLVPWIIDRPNFIGDVVTMLCFVDFVTVICPLSVYCILKT